MRDKVEKVCPFCHQKVKVVPTSEAGGGAFDLHFVGRAIPGADPRFVDEVVCTGTNLYVALKEEG